MKRALSLLLAVVLLAVSVTVLIGCRYSFVTGDAYDDDGYNVGSKTYAEQITAVEVVWKCGQLVVENGEQTAVSESAEELQEEQRVRSVVKDGVLCVQFWKSAYASSVNPSDKSVTVVVPSGVSVKITSTSGEIRCEDVVADSVVVDKMSGSFCASSVVANTVDLGSTSGAIKTNAIMCNSLKVRTTSGSVSLGDVAAKQVQVNSTSGSVSFNITSACEQVNVDSTSGSVRLRLQDIARGVTASLITTSGSKVVSVEHAQNGNEYVVGSGACALRVKCTSGSVYLSGSH